MNRQLLLNTLLILLLLVSILSAQNRYTIKGAILSAEQGALLAGANVKISGTTIGTSSNVNGLFSLSKLPTGVHNLIVNYMGYSERHIRVTLTNSDTTITIQMSRNLIDGPIVSVTASRVQNPLSPVVYTDLDKRDIENTYTTQDIPEMLADLPATTFYSEAGNGAGYNYLSIRGFDQRRISVLVNGIPQNDPEDHNVYWIDFPDLLANTQSIQVQRGGGSAFYGPAAIGGSINILTNYLSPKRKLTATAGIGSFNTRKFSLSYNTGLLKDHFVFFGRASNLKSDGYRDRAWVDLWNYFLGAAYYSDKHSLRVHFFGGPIKDGLVYNGLPKFYNNDSELRRKNYSWWGVDEDNGELYTTERRRDEIENFNQPHFEVLHEYRPNDNLSVNNSFFYVKGTGFFDFDGSWGWSEYFRLTPEYGFDVDTIPSDALIRASVENDQVGWLPQIIYRDGANEMILGAELRLHRSLHWGRLQKGSGLPEGVAGDDGRRYYEYKGAKDIASIYYHQTYELYPKLLALGNLQFSYKKYRLYDEKYVGNDMDLTYQFINPRIGLNYEVSRNANLYMNISHTTREPRMKNYYDAAESSAGAIPQFEIGPDSSFDYSQPLVDPESLTGLELGYGYSLDRFRLTFNGYYMSFVNEIVKDGGLDQFGQPTTGNAKHTTHLGLEAGVFWQIMPRLALEANGAVSQNILRQHTVYEENKNGLALPIILDGNQIAGFPNQLANVGLIYSWQVLFLKLNMKYVGKMYTDNFHSEDRSVDPFTVLNFNFRYNLGALSVPQLSLTGRIVNVLDSKYMAHGIGNEFYPAATRNFFVGVKFEY